MAPPTKRKHLAQAAESNIAFDDNFFEMSSVVWYMLIIFGMATLGMITYRPEQYPYGILGPLGTMIMSLRENNEKSFQTIFKMACIIHIIEGFMCFRLCRQMKLTSVATLKWTGQTFLLGFPSFGILLRYNTHLQAQKKHKQS